MRFVTRALAAVVLGFTASFASAALSSSDWRESGDGLLTVDSVTGLAWLDLTQTSGLSFDAVVAGTWQAAPWLGLQGDLRRSENLAANTAGGAAAVPAGAELVQDFPGHGQRQLALEANEVETGQAGNCREEGRVDRQGLVKTLACANDSLLGE